MVAHEGVTCTLSDYWELGPPFPWGLHLSFEPFFWGGGGIALGIPLFSLSCFYSFQTYFSITGEWWPEISFSTIFLCSFIHKPTEQLKSVFSGPFLWPRLWEGFAVPWIKLTRTCVRAWFCSPCRAWFPPPPTCFRCGWIGHYANSCRFQPYARRGATTSAFGQRSQSVNCYYVFILLAPFAQ